MKIPFDQEAADRYWHRVRAEKLLLEWELAGWSWVDFIWAKP